MIVEKNWLRLMPSACVNGASSCAYHLIRIDKRGVRQIMIHLQRAAGLEAHQTQAGLIDSLQSKPNGERLESGVS